MESIKDIITKDQKFTANKSECNRTTMNSFNSTLNWIDDEGYSGYPTTRVNGFAIVLCCDDNDFTIQVFDESDWNAIEYGEMYDCISGFESFDNMYCNAEYVAFTLANTIR